jgi:hypothetical protein
VNGVARFMSDQSPTHSPRTTAISANDNKINNSFVHIVVVYDNVTSIMEPTKQQTVAFFAHVKAQKANKVSIFRRFFNPSI